MSVTTATRASIERRGSCTLHHRSSLSLSLSPSLSLCVRRNSITHLFTLISAIVDNRRADVNNRRETIHVYSREVESPRTVRDMVPPVRIKVIFS